MPRGKKTNKQTEAKSYNHGEEHPQRYVNQAFFPRTKKTGIMSLVELTLIEDYVPHSQLSPISVRPPEGTSG